MKDYVENKYYDKIFYIQVEDYMVVIREVVNQVIFSYEIELLKVQFNFIDFEILLKINICRGDQKNEEINIIEKGGQLYFKEKYFDFQV